MTMTIGKLLLTSTLSLVLGAFGWAAVYHALLRRRVLDWGARADEAAGRLPGDDLLVSPDVVATRAITIEAPPAAVWPWLIQMGPGRGGVYTYDWIENLFGLDMHSADEIVPEWQSMEVGYIWRNPQGKGMRVEIVDPERAIVLRAEDGGWVWAFVLEPEGGGTRLISRNRFLLTGSALARHGFIYLMEPGSLVMERKMLQGIKARAERPTRPAAAPSAVAPGDATAPAAPGSEAVPAAAATWVAPAPVPR
jgi:hypothetical protein